MAWNEINSRIRSSFGRMRIFKSLSRNAEGSQELGQVPLHPFADLKNAFVDVLHFGDLDHLINGLLDGRAGVISHLLGCR